MASKPLLSLFLILSSWVFVGFSQSLDSILQQLTSPAGSSFDSMPCMQKLLPCQQFLNSHAPPPSSCCLPLTAMIKDDAKCLCSIFNNPDLLKSFNVTQEDALKLPKACGTKADISICEKVNITASNTTDLNTTDLNTSSSSSTSSAAIRGIHYGVSGFGAILVALGFSAF
ncbi:Lipid transfer protein [Quillaja saponaria]|uniref:Lipid transfer protein n=1 Tax=Quillaja saponaria TaxID=32244 RepID=A0AAD7Q5P9_QUISA|nr:Lipid transfer protein [Quillaja saponaria]